MTTDVMEKPAKVAINGVDVPTLLATVKVVGEQPPAAQFQFRANSEWVSGTHSRQTVNGYFGAGAEQAREAGDFTVNADHTAVLCGTDMGPTPVEYLLTALAACLTAGIANIASAKQIKLNRVNAKVEGDINLLGLLGLDASVRNGYQGIRVTIDIDGDATAEELKQIVGKSVQRSAVFDMLTNGTDVRVDVA